MNKKIQEIVNFLDTVSPDSKIYIGCDSKRYKKGDGFWARFNIAVAIHKNNKNGCKVFNFQDKERVYQDDPKKPSYRLMMEVYKVVDFYLKLYPYIEGRDVEIHLDINPNEKYFSSKILKQAVGYVKGCCGIIPKTKDNAWAASYAADRMVK